MEQQLAEAEQEISQAPNPGLIDYLPVSAVDLAALPDDLSRRLFEALRLEINYDCRTRTATCRVTLVGETIDAVARASHDAVVLAFPSGERLQQQKGPEMEIKNDLFPGTVCAVHPTSQYTNLNLLVSGLPISVKPAHAKVRRDGYRQPHPSTRQR
ncbi:hypothetical protein [Amycolatopsis dongchuanensis]|uniref:Uncharacterized protein n=1 Tax=Amycolatopsis dongchuanensis TaxID=1070866 RepID=A0ABP9QYT3_9PSEU